MTRLNMVLLLALIVSSLWLVRTSHDTRRLFAELDRARSEQDLLEAEGKRLDAEREAQATSMRVDSVARTKLAMRAAHAGVTQYVDDNLAPASGSAK